MNEIVNMFLLAADKFMPEIHLKQPGFTYSFCVPFTKNKERMEKFMQAGVKCVCKFGANVCNNKQRWNKDKCRCECKEVIDKWEWDKGFTWNPSNSECEFDKACDVGEDLDHENCKCRKKSVDKLVNECTETVDKVKLSSNNLSWQ